MKKLFITIIALLALAMPTMQAQDARQRAVETIVQDALAQMPTQNQEDFNREMLDLAKAAPQSVLFLAQMLQPAENHTNNLVEYAISGLTAYVSGNKQYKENVLNGLSMAAPRAIDITAREFLQEQMRLLSDEQDEPTYTGTPLCEPYVSLYTLLENAGSNAGAEIIKAMKSKDHAYRMEALKFATDNNINNDAFAKKLASKYSSMTTEGKIDIINWLGDNKVASQKALLTKLIMKGGDTAPAAIEALGKIGGEDAACTLMEQLGTANDDAATTALRSLQGDLSTPLCNALAKAKGDKHLSLMNLACDRRVKAAAPQILALCDSDDKTIAVNAQRNLYGVVTTADALIVAGKLDAATDAKQQKCYSDALSYSLKALSSKEQFDAVNNLINTASNKERLYPILASTKTKEAAMALEAIWKKDGNKDALAALKLYSNPYTIPALEEAAFNKNDESALQSLSNLYLQYVGDADDRCSKLVKVLNATKQDGVKTAVIKNLGKTPTPEAFATVGKFIDESDMGYTAALAAKTIAAKCGDEIEFGQLKETLQKASDRIKKHGTADDGYAVDEINQMILKAEPAPISVLTDEEAAQGFEMLFNGTDLDNWVGNKVGYVSQNGCIYVTANYGDESNLYTVKEYQDFVFRFEFCFLRPGINNGVGIRTPMGVDAAYYGMCESQILDHDDPIYAGLRDYQVHGSVYGIIPAKRIKHKPLGEWSYEEIRVQGDHITVTVNGEVIVDGDIREACQGHNVAPDGSDNNPYTVDHHNHPGMFNKTGHIGFLGHGAGLKLRNVRVLDLTPKATPKKAKKAKK